MYKREKCWNDKTNLGPEISGDCHCCCVVAFFHINTHTQREYGWGVNTSFNLFISHKASKGDGVAKVITKAHSEHKEV